MTYELPFNASYRARALGASAISQATRSFHVADGLRAVWPGAIAAGPAYPVECAPGDNLALHLAVECAPAGSVLVVATSEATFGYWDELLSRPCKTP
jgi:4-hydroxy-4-methyl-2-oxoglutarate aldolase